MDLASTHTTRFGSVHLRNLVAGWPRERRRAVGAAAFPWPAPVVKAVNVYACGLFVLLCSTTVSRCRWSRLLVRRRAEILLVPVCLAYLFLLYASWNPDTLEILFPGSLEAGLSGGFKPQFFPTLSGIAHLFSRCEITASSMWLHLLAMNLFAAVQICLDGLRRNIFTLHSVLLCVLSGILGLFSHYVTASLPRKQEKIERREDFTIFKFTK